MITDLVKKVFDFPQYRTPRSRTVSEADGELLEEIRDRYKAWDEIWQRHRKERDIDMRYICGNPWEDRDRNARRDAGRPCINHDELGQYVNQSVNNVRMNKRGIKADPRSFGSSEKSALLRQDIIRTIEYDSNGPSIYAAAYQQMVEGSYAFFRIGRRYVSDRYSQQEPQPQGIQTMPQDVQSRNAQLFQQEIVIKPIGNPNSVIYDPNCQEPDWADARGCFVLERIPKDEFKRRWPKAQITNFSWDDKQIISGWITEEEVIVAEYWRVELEDQTLYMLPDGTITDSSSRGYQKSDKKRKLQTKKVMQYITNGLEILERSDEPEPGNLLPIIPMIGLERYTDEGGGGFSRRVLFSLVRLARDPQMSLAYLNSQEMEEAGLSPKSPFMGYKGQFDSNRDMWTTITKIPYAFLETDIPDNWPAGQIPPLPQRVPFTPNFQSYEVAKDSCRRAIQAAMGITPLPTAAQRDNQKSGIALERVESQEAIGSYHFVDGYDRALRLAGRVIDQWIPYVYGEERDLHVRKPDESYRLLKLNTPTPYPDATNPGQLVQYPVEEVDHSIAVSTGPSYDSQRREIQSFLDLLVQNLQGLPLAPPQAARLLSLAIKMRNMGPQGDQLAEIVYPTEGSPDQGQAQMQALQMQNQQMTMQLQQLQAAVQQLVTEKQAKIVEGEYKMALEKLRSETNLLIERLKVDAQMAVAQVQSKDQVGSERTAAIHAANEQAAEQMHELQQLEQQHAHEKWLAQQEYEQQVLEGQQQQQQQAQQQAAQQQQPAEGQ